MRKGVLYNLPTIDFPTLQHIERVRNSAQQSLEGCSILGTPYLDHDRAGEIMCTCAVEDASIRLEFYRNQAGFREEWKWEISDRAVLSILGCFPNLKFEMRGGPRGLPALFEDPRQFVEEMTRAVAARFFADQPPEIPDSVKEAMAPLLRKALAKVYQDRFPQAAIIDICWAAHQHRREWQRWLKGELPHGSKADRSFRQVLLGSKSPKELRKELRPKGWK